LVTGFLNDVKIHVLVNHWPSKRENDKGTEYKRLVASNKVIDIISMLKLEDVDANILVMGDFNDNPTSKSVKGLVNTCHLLNPFETLRTFSRGSTNHNRQWHLFDQILLTDTFFNAEGNNFQFRSANIFDDLFLKNSEGKHKGSPNRTFQGVTYRGGYSDHFPVYVILG
jgi:predicted extracellular nuclease